MPDHPPEPRSLRHVLSLIRDRPAMYLGTKSLTALSHFVLGYQFACRVHGATEPLSPAGLAPDFTAWLAREKGLGQGARSPFHDLADHSSEDAAFDRFFDLLDEFEAASRPATGSET